MLIPARVLRARHSPLTRLGCHVRWVTGKVTSGDKRPQLESVSNPPPSFFSAPSLPIHAHTDPHLNVYARLCLKNLLAVSLQYRQPSESSRSIDFLHFATA